MAVVCETANDFMPIQQIMSSFAVRCSVDDRSNTDATDMVAEFWSLCADGWSLWSYPNPSPGIVDTPIATIHMLGSSLVNSSELLTEDDIVSIIATIIVATVVESQDQCGVRSFSAAQTVDVSLNDYPSEWWHQFFEICDDPCDYVNNTDDLAGRMAGPDVWRKWWRVSRKHRSRPYTCWVAL